MEPIWVDAPQGSEEWLSARVGHLSASRMSDALDYTKKGEPGAKRKQLLLDLMAEMLTGRTTPVYVNGAMRWGTETEPAAREAYAAMTGNDVIQCGFAISPTIKFFGASPDGLVGDDGLLEIKCPASATMVRWLLDGVVPEDHHNQMITQCAVTGRKWVDFCAFDPRICEPYHIFVRRFTPSPGDIERIEAEARSVSAELAAMYNTIKNRMS